MNLLILIMIVLFVIIIVSNDKYYHVFNKVYKYLTRMPKMIVIIISLISLFYLKLPDNNILPKSELNVLKTVFHPQQTGQKPEKRSVTESTKKLIAAKQGWKCGNCGKLLDETYEVDHIKPLYKGGSNDITNLMALDPICHRKKTLSDKLSIK